jgi:hypothetical protein
MALSGLSQDRLVKVVCLTATAIPTAIAPDGNGQRRTGQAGQLRV